MSFGYMVVIGFLYGIVYIISGIHFCKCSTMAQKTVTTDKEVFFFLPMSLFIARRNIMVYMIRHSCTQHCQNTMNMFCNVHSIMAHKTFNQS